jgi:hypothetical protein
VSLDRRGRASNPLRGYEKRFVPSVVIEVV